MGFFICKPGKKEETNLKRHSHEQIFPHGAILPTLKGSQLTDE
jgi:hypothetical protein